MKTIITCFLLVCTCTAGALAQSASETAKAYLDAMESGQYRKAAEFLEPDALREARKMLDLGKALPEEVAKQFYPQFFGAGATSESVRQLSDSEFLARFLSSVAKQGDEVGVNVLGKVKILGEVPEGTGAAQLEQSKALGVEIVSFSGARGKELLGKKRWESDSYTEARRARNGAESGIYVLKKKAGFERLAANGIERVRGELYEKVLACNGFKLVELRRQKREKQRRQDWSRAVPEDREAA